MTKFIKISGIDEPARYLADQIQTKLSDGQKVLLLLPGGSAIAVAAAASKLLSGLSLSNLSIFLTDERYGDVGHQDSNWLQLQKAGFKMDSAQLEPVLKGQGMKETTAKFEAALKQNLENSDFRIGLFGMGADGHTAGILPASPAVTSDNLVVSYKTPEFERITITPKAIIKLDEAVVYAMGSDKQVALDSLERNLPINRQPAQILKKTARLTVYNDYKGESA